MTFIDLLSEYHIMPQFPPNVVRWAESAPKAVLDKDLVGREDLSQKLIITIDGDDAKDFDDAVSLEILEGGNYLLGVHIADVTHYVTENSAVDRAAFLRGTSVYLIDTVIPMLPFELSNELCSLKPNEVRLTVSVFMEINAAGKIEAFKICKGFIKSKARMTYAEVTKILEGDMALNKKYSHLAPMLGHMQRLVAVLNQKRVKEGSIEFVTHESKITLDKNGVPLKVERYPITISNNIIEEFMLAANVTVAKYLTEKKLPCVYRVHEAPDFERVERLATVLPSLGVDFRFKADMKPKDFQKILESVSGTDVSDVVSYLALRSMSRARYSEKNLGHFGLSFSDYCHFTSPIRRYPDIVVHRVLKESLEGEISDTRRSFLNELAISASITSSMTESNAADAEFKWKDIKKAEYMMSHIGERHMAVITHITTSGFFAELENTVEGFVAARTIEDDLYMMSENGLSLKGMRTKRKFTVGDRVEIKVVSADAETAKIDFEVAGTRALKPQRSKRNKGKDSKKLFSREEKLALRNLKVENREERRERFETRQKAESEKYIFENAVTYELLELLLKKKSFKKAEKSFAGVSVNDFAATVALPVYKSYMSGDNAVSLKNALISASMGTQNTVQMICDSFGIDADEEMLMLAREYVKKALAHFGKSLDEESLNFKKREQEYDKIMERLKAKRR